MDLALDALLRSSTGVQDGTASHVPGCDTACCTRSTRPDLRHIPSKGSSGTAMGMDGKQHKAQPPELRERELAVRVLLAGVVQRLERLKKQLAGATEAELRAQFALDEATDARERAESELDQIVVLLHEIAARAGVDIDAGDEQAVEAIGRGLDRLSPRGGADGSCHSVAASNEFSHLTNGPDPERPPGRRVGLDGRSVNVSELLGHLVDVLASPSGDVEPHDELVPFKSKQWIADRLTEAVASLGRQARYEPNSTRKLIGRLRRQLGELSRFVETRASAYRLRRRRAGDTPPTGPSSP